MSVVTFSSNICSCGVSCGVGEYIFLVVTMYIDSHSD